jgi:hypothetical protein
MAARMTLGTARASVDSLRSKLKSSCCLRWHLQSVSVNNQSLRCRYLEYGQTRAYAACASHVNKGQLQIWWRDLSRGVAYRYIPGGRDSLYVAGQQAACLGDVELSLICSTAALVSVRLLMIHACAWMYGLLAGRSEVTFREGCWPCDSRKQLVSYEACRQLPLYEVW